MVTIKPDRIPYCFCIPEAAWRTARIGAIQAADPEGRPARLRSGVLREVPAP